MTTLPALILAAALSAQTAPGPASQKAFTLRALTYNIHGIALTKSGDEDDKALWKRYEEIARRLKAARASGQGPQLVAIQEAWHPISAKAAKEAGYPYVVAGGGARFPKVGGAGLFILSDFPVLLTETVAYDTCTGWDCVATKGALHVRVDVPGVGPMDVYDTHTNAEQDGVKPADSMAARVAQLKIYADFVRRTRDPKYPALVMGDFNMKPSGEDYALFESLSGAANAVKDCLLSHACAGQDPGEFWSNEIDHQFHFDGESAALKTDFVAQTFKEPFNGKPLSDHWALEAHYSVVKP